MRKFIILLLFGLILSGSAPAQEGWFIQKKFEDIRISNIFFLNDELGWAITSQNILHSSDGGDTWEYQYDRNPDILLNNIYFSDPKHGWAAEWYNQMFFITTDGGENWRTGTRPFELEFVSKIFFYDSTRGWACGDYGFVSRTVDGGNNWERQSLQGPHHMQHYDIHFPDSLNGWVTGSGGVFHTGDGGISWNQQAENLDIYGNCIFFFDADNGWLGDAHGIYHTSNGGTDWSKQDSSIISDISFMTKNKGWAIGNGGKILYTTNGGENWNQQYSGVETGLTTICMIDSNSGWILAGEKILLKTKTGGVTSASDNVINEKSLNIYPNPFSGQTKIEFSIQESAYIKVSIYDTFGREVDILIDGFKEIGNYSEIFKSSGLPDGLYFTKLNINGNSTVRKMILIK